MTLQIYISYCFYIFFLILEIFLLLYLIQGILPLPGKIRMYAFLLVYPMMYPMEKLLQRSILGNFSINLSPYILLVIVYYCINLCNYFLH